MSVIWRCPDCGKELGEATRPQVVIHDCRQRGAADLRRQIEQRERDLAEWREAAAKAAGENCPTDKQHCACVSLLRVENERLSEALYRIEAAQLNPDLLPQQFMERVAKIVKGALRQ